MRDGELRRLATHINILLWSVLGVYPDAFDTNPHSVEKTLVYIPVASRSQWVRPNLEEIRRKCAWRWQYSPCATYISEFV